MIKVPMMGIGRRADGFNHEARAMLVGTDLRVMQLFKLIAPNLRHALFSLGMVDYLLHGGGWQARLSCSRKEPVFGVLWLTRCSSANLSAMARSSLNARVLSLNGA